MMSDEKKLYRVVTEVRMLKVPSVVAGSPEEAAKIAKEMVRSSCDVFDEDVTVTSVTESEGPNEWLRKHFCRLDWPSTFVEEIYYDSY